MVLMLAILGCFAKFCQNRIVTEPLDSAVVMNFAAENLMLGADVR